MKPPQLQYHFDVCVDDTDEKRIEKLATELYADFLQHG